MTHGYQRGALFIGEAVASDVEFSWSGTCFTAGVKCPTLFTLKRLAVALGCRYDELMVGVLTEPAGRIID